MSEQSPKRINPDLLLKHLRELQRTLLERRRIAAEVGGDKVANHLGWASEQIAAAINGSVENTPAETE